jgi:TolB protein
MMRRVMGGMVVVMLGLLSQPAQAKLELDITQGNFEPMPIAVPDFAGVSGDMGAVGRNIAGVVAADLERSGLFRIVDKAAYIEQISYNTLTPRFADWRQINTDALVVGKVDSVGAGKMKVSFRLYDNAAEIQAAGKQFDATAGNWRRIAHLISDEIYKRITGEEGYFDTRIVYVAESGPETRKIKRLAIMDQDSENHKFLTDGRALVLTPRFSPNTQEILYLSYAGGAPRVYLRDLQTGREESLGRFDGMSFAPRFNNNGNRMVMSIARGGVTNIYGMDLRSRQLGKLTQSPAIDTSPSYSPDGSQIVFNSDRGGSQQLYIMSASGGGAKRISFGSGQYSTPVWSPRGDMIAFTKQSSGRFHIGLMRTDGSGERMITDSWLDEGPTWAPNGRVLMFSRQSGGGGRQGLYSIDVTGRNLRRVPTPIEATDPAWSPLLPL